jgi:hypothetical protein
MDEVKAQKRTLIVLTDKTDELKSKMKDGKRHLLFLANSADEKAVKNACNLKTT